MIQKIRSYLLDDQDHRDLFAWLVVVVIMVPAIAMFFQYRKNYVSTVGAVNEKKIEKSIFQLRLFEQMKMFESIAKLFGEEQSRYFYDMLFQGKSVEQYVLSQEIRRLFLHSLFVNNISSQTIANDYILKNLRSDGFEKMKFVLGELPFLLVTGQIKPIAMGNLNVDIKKIDSYCSEVFESNLMKNIFLVPLAAIEKMSFNNYPGLPIKINLIIYSYHFNKESDYKKLIEKNMISENEIYSRYTIELAKENYQELRSFSSSISCFVLKDEKKKLNEKNKIFQDKLDFLIKENKNKEDILKSIFLDGDLSLKKNYQNIAIVVNNGNVGEIVNSKDKDSIARDIPLEARKKIILNIFEDIKNNKNLDYYFIVYDGCLYYFENIVLEDVKYKKLEDVSNDICNLIVEKRAKDFLIDDIEKNRYNLEKKMSASFLSKQWKKDEFVFIKDEVQKNDTGKKRYDLIMKKLSSGGIREGNTLVVVNEDENMYELCYIDTISYECKEKVVTRRDQFKNKDFFVDSLERLAKIDIHD